MWRKRPSIRTANLVKAGIARFEMSLDYRAPLAGFTRFLATNLLENWLPILTCTNKF